MNWMRYNNKDYVKDEGAPGLPEVALSDAG
jgi:hypothetical protein